MHLLRYISLFSLLTLCACNAKYRLGHDDLSLYNKNFDVNYQVVEGSLILQLPSGKYQVELKAYESYKGKNLLFSFQEEKTTFTAEYLYYRLPAYTYFLLSLNVVDLENQNRFHDILVVDSRLNSGIKTKKHTHNLPDSNVSDTVTSVLLLPYVKPNTSLSFSDKKGSTSFSFSYFDQVFPPALPPYAEEDSSFEPSSEAAGKIYLPANIPYEMTKRGLYFIQDSLEKKGIFINCFDKIYPEVNKVHQLITALRYITTHEEYEQLNTATDPKLALDEYWLSRSSSKNRARNMIAVFYNRISEANTFFTTYKEGWKTDRGMIYTIFGRADEVEKYPDFEHWYYDYIDGRRSVGFFFDKENGQFILRRNTTLELPWMEQIHIWRQGVVPGGG